MMNKAFNVNLLRLTVWLCTWLFLAVVNAQDTMQTENAGEQAEEIFNLVQNSSSQSNVPPPPSGTIILPDSLVNKPDEEKKCMTVCARWGEDCTYINRGAGGMTRSCRRTCQQFTEECF